MKLSLSLAALAAMVATPAGAYEVPRPGADPWRAVVAPPRPWVAPAPPARAVEPAFVPVALPPAPAPAPAAPPPVPAGSGLVIYGDPVSGRPRYAPAASNEAVYGAVPSLGLPAMADAPRRSAFDKGSGYMEVRGDFDPDRPGEEWMPMPAMRTIVLPDGSRRTERARPEHITGMRWRRTGG